MNAVRTPSIVLLFHSYMFQDLLSLYPRSIPFSIVETIRHDESGGSHFSRRVSLQLCRGYDPRRMRGKNFTRVHSACSSRTLENLRRPLFIYKPCKLGRSSSSNSSNRFSSSRTLLLQLLPRNVPRETLEKEKGVLVNRTFRRFVSRSRITKFSRAVEAWKQAARRIVVLGDFTKPDNGAI